jgi:L-threonylcarbamoyladenylate synthase
MPTETVYGLAANAGDGEAVARIFEAKGRPRINPLIVHLAEPRNVENFAISCEFSGILAESFWPGPLTLVMPRREGAPLSDLVSAGLPTVAIRIPAHSAARDLIRAAGVPIAAPSANLSGQVSPTTAAHVAADLGHRVDMVLDGGPCTAGLESTIIGFPDGVPTLLRAGAIPREAVEAVLGRPLALPAPACDGTLLAPGMMTSHYAPRARLRLDADAPRSGEAYLAFGPAPDRDAPTLTLSAARNLREAAANLFAHLRSLDTGTIEVIAVAPIPEEGLGEAINDRLRRAAAPRSVERT